MILDENADYALQNGIALLIVKKSHAPMVCAQEILNMMYDANTELGVNIWNAAVEACANLVNDELGTEPMNHYYFERKLRELKK